jgi:hypothetical protein
MSIARRIRLSLLAFAVMTSAVSPAIAQGTAGKPNILIHHG